MNADHVLWQILQLLSILLGKKLFLTIFSAEHECSKKRDLSPPFLFNPHKLNILDKRASAFNEEKEKKHSFKPESGI